MRIGSGLALGNPSFGELRDVADRLRIATVEVAGVTLLAGIATHERVGSVFV